MDGDGRYQHSSNLLVICPNHHKGFDLGELAITEQTDENLSSTLNGDEFTINVGVSGAARHASGVAVPQ